MPTGKDFSAFVLFLAFRLTFFENSLRKLLWTESFHAIFKQHGPSAAKGCKFTHIQKFIRMSRTKSLIQNHKRKILMIALPSVCVPVCRFLYACYKVSRCVCLYGRGRLAIVPTWFYINNCWSPLAIVNFHKSQPFGLLCSFALFLHGVKMLMTKISILCSGNIVLMINALHCKDQEARVCHGNWLWSHSVFQE